MTDYYYNSGFIFLLAKKHGAKVIFAEHRYFGESMPFGNVSFNPGNIGFLSPAQVGFRLMIFLSNLNFWSGAC